MRILEKFQPYNCTTVQLYNCTTVQQLAFFVDYGDQLTVCYFQHIEATIYQIQKLSNKVSSHLEAVNVETDD